MNIGYDTVLSIRRTEALAEKLGFRFANAKHYSQSYGDRISLLPATEMSLPIYSRDAEIFTGTLGEVAIFMRGLEWARDYDRMLKVSTDTIRSKKEQNVRNDQLVRALGTDLTRAAKIE